MAEKVTFSTDDLTFTSDGKVIISNSNVVKSLADSIRRIDPASAGIFDNCNCSRAEALSEVSLAGKLKAQDLSLALKGTSGIFDNCSCK